MRKQVEGTQTVSEDFESSDRDVASQALAIVADCRGYEWFIYSMMYSVLLSKTLSHKQEVVLR